MDAQPGFTGEQAALLTHAMGGGHILVTVVGSANDILWGLMADEGLMEPAELPSGLAAIPGLDWHAWKATPEARAALAKALPSTEEKAG